MRTNDPVQQNPLLRLCTRHSYFGAAAVDLACAELRQGFVLRADTASIQFRLNEETRLGLYLRIDDALASALTVLNMKTLARVQLGF